MKKFLSLGSLVLIFLVLWIYIVNSDSVNGQQYKAQIELVKERMNGSAYNKKYCFLVDFSIHSGKKRMFLYNLETGEVEKSFLVAHGEGCGEENGTPRAFSNIPNSLCSSEGMAVIGERAYSNYGIHIKYWLQGLDETNSNIRKRVVVIHSWLGIPDFAIYPFKIIQSQGCFTISNASLTYLDEFISKQENQRILFYAFKS